MEAHVDAIHLRACRALFQLHMPKYHDQLVKDMGEPHLRKGRNKLAEIFQPYCAADYKDLFA